MKIKLLSLFSFLTFITFHTFSNKDCKNQSIELRCDTVKFYDANEIDELPVFIFNDSCVYQISEYSGCLLMQVYVKIFVDSLGAIINIDFIFVNSSIYCNDTLNFIKAKEYYYQKLDCLSKNVICKKPGMLDGKSVNVILMIPIKVHWVE